MFTDADLDRVAPLQAPGTTAEKLCRTCRRLQQERATLRTESGLLAGQLERSQARIEALEEECARLRADLWHTRDLVCPPAPPPPEPPKRWYQWTR